MIIMIIWYNKYAHNIDVLFLSDISEFHFDIRVSIYTHRSGNSPIKFATSGWLLTKSLDITSLICKRPSKKDLYNLHVTVVFPIKISQTTLKPKWFQNDSWRLQEFVATCFFFTKNPVSNQISQPDKEPGICTIISKKTHSIWTPSYIVISGWPFFTSIVSFLGLKDACVKLQYLLAMPVTSRKGIWSIQLKKTPGIRTMRCSKVRLFFSPGALLRCCCFTFLSGQGAALEVWWD